MKKYIKPVANIVAIESAAIMVGSVNQEQGNGVQLKPEARDNRGSDWDEFEK